MESRSATGLVGLFLGDRVSIDEKGHFEVPFRGLCHEDTQGIPSLGNIKEAEHLHGNRVQNQALAVTIKLWVVVLSL